MPFQIFCPSLKRIGRSTGRRHRVPRGAERKGALPQLSLPRIVNCLIERWNVCRLLGLAYVEQRRTLLEWDDPTSMAPDREGHT